MKNARKTQNSYKCEFCGKRYIRKSALESHLANVHGTELLEEELHRSPENKPPQVTCYIRENANIPRLGGQPGRVYPWLMETYPVDRVCKRKGIHRRDFECLTVEEAKAIARAIYGTNARISVDGE